MFVELVAFFQVKFNSNDKTNCLDFSKELSGVFSVTDELYNLNLIIIFEKSI